MDLLVETTLLSSVHPFCPCSHLPALSPPWILSARDCGLSELAAWSPGLSEPYFIWVALSRAPQHDHTDSPEAKLWAGLAWQNQCSQGLGDSQLLIIGLLGSDIPTLGFLQPFTLWPQLLLSSDSSRTHLWVPPPGGTALALSPWHCRHGRHAPSVPLGSGLLAHCTEAPSPRHLHQPGPELRPSPRLQSHMATHLGGTGEIPGPPLGMGRRVTRSLHPGGFSFPS